MPRGDKSKYTDRQKRKAQHIEEGYEQRGVPEKEAERRAWATVNKESGGGNKSGSGRGVPDTKVSAKKGGKLGGKAAASRPAHERRASEVRYWGQGDLHGQSIPRHESLSRRSSPLGEREIPIRRVSQ